MIRAFRSRRPRASLFTPAGRAAAVAVVVLAAPATFAISRLGSAHQQPVMEASWVSDCQVQSYGQLLPADRSGASMAAERLACDAKGRCACRKRAGLHHRRALVLAQNR